MTTDESYIQRMLTSWEEVAKHGQLTLWVLLALKDGPKYMSDIKSFLIQATNGTITADDKSLYRALRRYHQTELVDFETAPGNGPDRKVYHLAPIGSEVLSRFIRRNITDIFFKPEIIRLMQEERT